MYGIKNTENDIIPNFKLTNKNPAKINIGINEKVGIIFFNLKLTISDDGIDTKTNLCIKPKYVFLIE